MYRLTLKKLRILSATKTFDRADVQTEMKEFKARVLMSTDESVRLEQPLSIKVWTDLSETLCACQQMFPLPLLLTTQSLLGVAKSVFRI
jgi:hypothetical protein